MDMSVDQVVAWFAAFWTLVQEARDIIRKWRNK